jgi:hypothetical protein
MRTARPASRAGRFSRETGGSSPSSLSKSELLGKGCEMLFLKSLLRACVAAAATAAVLGNVTPAFAAAGEITASVTAVSPQVTYSSTGTGLTTFFALQGQLTNGSPNTINDVTITVKVSATDPAEQIELFDAGSYLPSACTQTSPSQFTCALRQLKSGASFPATPFTVFYKAPVKVVNGVADGVGADTIKADVHLVYAEGTRDTPSVPQNSVRDLTFASLVTLGTDTQVNVKSAVPKSGASLFTDAGVPSAANKAAERADIPSLSVPFAISDITIGDNTADAQCINLGHFYQCPVFFTSIQDGSLQEALFPNPPWLTTIYRIDLTNLKIPTSKLLTSVQLLYTGGIFTDFPVLACVNGAPNTGAPTDAQPAGVPCVLSSQCFKKGTLGSENGFCEWDLINIRNGSLKIL